MDVRAAEATPGVLAVFTAADVPVNEYGLTMFDQPVLVGLRDTGRSAVAADVSRWEGDQIAIVVAESADAADLGAERLDVEWEDLPVVPDIDAALTGDVMVRPDLHPDSNIYVTYRLRKGDTAAGWDQAEVVVEGTYRPALPGARLPPAGGRGQLDRRRGSDHGRRRRPVDPRGPGADRPRPRPPGRAGPGRLPGHRRRLRRAGGHVAADRHGPGLVAPGRPGRAPSDPLPVEPRGVDRRPPQAPPRSGPRPVGSDRRRPAGGGRGHRPPRRRRLQLHDQQGAREPPPLRLGPLRDPAPGGRQLRGPDPRRARWRVPRLRCAPGRLRGRDPDEQAGRAPGHGPGRAAPAQPAARRVARPDGHRDAARCQPAGGRRPLRRRRPLDRAPPAGGGAARPSPPSRRSRTPSVGAGASPAGSRTWASPSASRSAARPASSSTATTTSTTSSCSTPAPRSARAATPRSCRWRRRRSACPSSGSRRPSPTRRRPATPARPRPPG